MKILKTTRDCRAFTMIEIAISLAVIGIALVAIIGVLPLGMNVQRENREETVINQDATVLMEAIRNGQRGFDDLTNYVYAITNYWTNFDNNASGVNGYNYSSASVASGFPSASPGSPAPINNGANIIGLLSTPELMDTNGYPAANLFNGGYSNHVVAYIRSFSGPAVEKPPQDNDIVRESSFGYRLLCLNAPVAADFDSSDTPYGRQLAASLHELRLTFLWPQLPNGKVGNGRQSFRTLIGGRLAKSVTNHNLYFYQLQSFTNAAPNP